MDKSLRIAHLELVINNSFDNISSYYHSYYWHKNNDYIKRDSIRDSYFPPQVSIAIKTLYNHIICYFETIGLTDYLLKFKNQFENRILNDDNLDEFSACIPVGIDGFEEDFVVLEEFRMYLLSFPFFGQREEKIKDNEYLKLKRILKETKIVLDYGCIEVFKEIDIINQVFKIITLYFSESTKFPKKSRSRFIGQFKHYQADILVPELSTAIEFKLIQKNAKTVDDYIDEIYVDSSNYVGDQSYDNFIAVVCLKNNISETKDRIKNCWLRKGFPENWELIIIQNI